MSKAGLPDTAAVAEAAAKQPLGAQLTASSSEGAGMADRTAPSSVRLQVLSDLHHDVRSAALPTLAPGADIVVGAGDMCQGPRHAFGHLRRTIPAPTPIVMVSGNHEHHSGCLPAVLAEARQDYALDSQQAAAMAAARRGLNDHRLIGWRKEPWLRFRPKEALAIHRASRRFLTDAMTMPFAGPTVVVTHHAPHPGSVHPRFARDPLNAAFASDLSDLIAAGQPALWVHGHVHSSFDYAVGATRIVCNPHGHGNENPAYDPHLTVEVAR